MDVFETLDSVSASDVFPNFDIQMLFHQKRMHIFFRKL